MTAGKPMRELMTDYIINLQNDIVAALESMDPSAPPFARDSWTRDEGGGGVSCTFAAPLDGRTTILEKAGVNISMIHGTLPPAAVRQMSTKHSSVPYDPENTINTPFFAAGISLILHPLNPNAPIVHANYRYFELTDKSSAASLSSLPDLDTQSILGTPKVLAWWFGGITDLTPAYLFTEDATHFHSILKAACDTHGPGLYPPFKKECDENLFIKHRNEYRGIGGIRFDDLCDEPHPLLEPSSVDSRSDLGTRPKRPHTAPEIFEFVKSLGDAFLPSYLPILERRHGMPSTDRMRRWQLLRRGRYVEYNLVYAQGTKFGLAAPGVNAENVLISMPPLASWEYMSDLGEEGDEAKVMEVLRSPRDWT